MVLGESIIGGLAAGAIIEFVKETINRIKGNKDEVFYPPDQEKFKKVIKVTNAPQLKKHPIIVEINGNYNYVSIDGKYGITSGEIGDGDKDIITTLKTAKDKDTDQKINIMSIEEAEKLIDYKNAPKYIEKDFLDLFAKLRLKYKSLISLAIYMEQCYESGKKEEANAFKGDIRIRHGPSGLKFVNLWSVSYLKSLFSLILQKPATPSDINKKLSEFIEKKAESIFFISPDTDYRRAMSDIKGSFKRRQPYIAIHSLGTAGLKALKIIENIKLPKYSEYEEVLITKKRERGFEVSKIWYTGEEGLKTYLLIKDRIA